MAALSYDQLIQEARECEAQAEWCRADFPVDALRWSRYARSYMKQAKDLLRARKTVARRKAAAALSAHKLDLAVRCLRELRRSKDVDLGAVGRGVITEVLKLIREVR